MEPTDQRLNYSMDVDAHSRAAQQAQPIILFGFRQPTVCSVPGVGTAILCPFQDLGGALQREAACLDVVADDVERLATVDDRRHRTAQA
jgi:hypothetical protein